MILALLIAASEPATTTPLPVPIAVTAQDADHTALAHDLAVVLNSEDLTRAQLRRLLDVTAPATFAGKPEFAAMEAAYPGVTAAMIAAIKPIAVDATIAALPKLWDRLAPIYAQAFTTAELREVLVFYRGPTGRMAIGAMGDGADFSKMLDSALTKENPTVNAADLNNGAQGGVAEIIRRSTLEDRAAMERLTASPAGKKLPEVATKTQEVIAAWSNEPDAASDAQLEKAITVVIERFIKAGKKSAPKGTRS